jgi:RimJ/RimL family protein N-acetyltransferase
MVTDRLQLVAATLDLCEAERQGPAAVAHSLGATVPGSWPPPVFEPDDVDRVRRQLNSDPRAATWTLHYVLRRVPSGTERPALVGVAGYSGPPTPDGVVEIGYAIAEEYQRQGYATEAVAALLRRCAADPLVRVVVATTYVALRPSIGVLEKTGFVEVSRSTETGLMRFEHSCASAG